MIATSWAEEEQEEQEEKGGEQLEDGPVSDVPPYRVWASSWELKNLGITQKCTHHPGQGQEGE